MSVSPNVVPPDWLIIHINLRIQRQFNQQRYLFITWNWSQKTPFQHSFSSFSTSSLLNKIHCRPLITKLLPLNSAWCYLNTFIVSMYTLTVNPQTMLTGMKSHKVGCHFLFY